MTEHQMTMKDNVVSLEEYRLKKEDEQLENEWNRLNEMFMQGWDVPDNWKVKTTYTITVDDEIVFSTDYLEEDKE